MAEVQSVTVLLSSYNGEKYIAQQLDSLLVQEGVNLRIWIRDDGSNDSTPLIIKEYAKKDARISFWLGKNIGFVQSFFELLKTAPESDFYAFCDQDDVWDKDKLLCGIEMIEKLDLSKPCAYYSNLRLVDKDLSLLGIAHEEPLNHSKKYYALARCNITGCTSIFNNVARNIIVQKLPFSCPYHDYWLFLVCIFFGNLIYDFEPHISYRQHENNVYGMKVSVKKRLTIATIWMHMKKRKDCADQSKISEAFLQIFSSLLSKRDKKELKKVIFYNKNFFSRLRLFFDWRISWYGFILGLKFKFKVLFGSL